MLSCSVVKNHPPKEIRLKGKLFTTCNAIYIPLLAKVSVVDGKDTVNYTINNGLYDIPIQTKSDWVELIVEPLIKVNSTNFSILSEWYQVNTYSHDKIIYKKKYLIEKNEEIENNIYFKEYKCSFTRPYDRIY
jgi:hypothetical protein